MAGQPRNFNPVASQSSLSRAPLPGNLILVTKTVFQGHPPVQSPAIQQPVNITYPKTEVVGHGSFGVVFVTTIQETQEKVAIKKVLQDKRFKNRELEIMQKIQHINIVDLKYYYYEEDPQSDSLYLNLILEFMSQSLYQRIRHYVHLQTTMPHDEVQIYMYQLFKGLNYIHGTLGICHRDIKPQNILINPENFQLKICDFGSAKRLNPMEPNVSYICSRYYRAPELIFGSTNYTTKIDVWSSACVMCELILGQPIFPGESGIDQLVEIIKILGTPNKQDICSMNPNYMEHKFPHIKPIPLIKIFKREKDYLCIELISNMLKYDPFERFSALQCLCSSYFDKIRMNYNNEIVTNLKLLDFNNDTDFDYLSQDEKLIVKQKLLPHLYSSINPSG
ncbi:regulator of ime2 [Hanseniaspora vineae]